MQYLNKEHRSEQMAHRSGNLTKDTETCKHLGVTGLKGLCHLLWDFKGSSSAVELTFCTPLNLDSSKEASFMEVFEGY
jgi:hypothetical protein